MAENLSKENKPPMSSAYLPSDNLNNSSKSCLLCGEHIAPNNSFFRVSREVLEKLREVLKTTVKHEPSFRLCKSCYRSIDTIHKRKNFVESLTTHWRNAYLKRFYPRKDSPELPRKKRKKNGEGEIQVSLKTKRITIKEIL